MQMDCSLGVRIIGHIQHQMGSVDTEQLPCIVTAVADYASTSATILGLTKGNELELQRRHEGWGYGTPVSNSPSLNLRGSTSTLSADVQQDVAYKNQMLESLSSEREKHRFLAAFETYTSEKWLWLDQAKMGRTPLRSEDIPILFGNIDDLYELSVTFTNDLRKIVFEWKADSHIGPVWLKLIPELKIYENYIRNSVKSTRHLVVIKERSGLVEWMNSLKTETIVDFASHLIMPVQRIVRHELLLKRSLSATAEDHTDHSQLLEALKEVEYLVKLINIQSIEEGENTKKLNAIEKSVANFKMTPNEDRLYVYEGVLHKVCRKSNKKRMFFLFSDALIYATISPVRQMSNKRRSVVITSSTIESDSFILPSAYQFRRWIDIRSLLVEDVPDTSSMKNAFQVVTTEEKSFTVYASDAKEKLTWMNHLQVLTRANKLGEVAPVWQSDTSVCAICEKGFTVVNRKHCEFSIIEDEIVCRMFCESEHVTTLFECIRTATAQVEPNSHPEKGALLYATLKVKGAAQTRRTTSILFITATSTYYFISLHDITMMRRTLFFLLVLTATIAQQCEQGFSYCPDVNACYEPTQYNCQPDRYNGQSRLCGAGTFSCNDVCIAECAYQCNANGTYSSRSDRTCPPTQVCQPGYSACGDACYNSDQYCCISGSPQDIQSCPQPTSTSCDRAAGCTFELVHVGQLHDGQLRLNYGPGAFPVNFTFTTDGKMVDNRGQTCYLAANGQLQCNFEAQTTVTDFCISGDYLSHAGGLVWYECDVGTGGSNLYNVSIDSQSCSALYLYVSSQCDSAPSTISQAPTGSAVTAPSTTSYVPPVVTSTPFTTTRCSSGFGITLPIPFFYFSFDLGVSVGGSIKDDSGNGRNGIVVGKPLSIFGFISAALSFDLNAGLQGIRIDNVDKLGLNFTIATWVKVKTCYHCDRFSIFSQVSANAKSTMKIATTKTGIWSSTKGWDLTFCPKTQRVTFSTAFQSVSWEVKVAAEAWFHLALTADVSGRVNLYVNGVAAASQNVRVSLSLSSKLYIASDKNKCSFSGSIDDFVAFNVALSLQQIVSIRDNRCATTTSTKSIGSTQATRSQTPVTVFPTKAPCDFCPKPPTPPKSTGCGFPWLYWSFDKIKNRTVCNDDSGHKRHGSFLSNCTLIDGILRRAVHHSATDSISLPDFSLSAVFSLSTWIKLSSSSQASVVATTKVQAGAAAGWELRFDAQAGIFTFESTGNSRASWTVQVNAGVWSHLAVSVENGFVELFINGISQGVKNITACVNSSVGLRVGVKLAAQLDEFLIFDRALDTEEVVDAMNKYKTGKDISAGSWSQKSNDLDWGVGWEKSASLDVTARSRISSWWKWI
ncbi:hypothetical protein PROFUN_08459 [Planoprotostelium fungivorum]|uniref:RhoGEF domain-containing protein n=1 Tax=Planoprotostelium fungivorum TaxID=1890364 RepID=A0A2P6N1V9_9EUKA|nr:hypothetical protein PROFUN_08459 [Planoprotostelium fungivorum]